MADEVDVLQIKIDQAKSKLPESTLNAISAVPWQAAILKMRETKGYSFEQLGDLETETELVLCGLLSPKQYPIELKARMKISEAQANELVNTMNEEVFSKIREELVKTTEKNKVLINPTPSPAPTPIKINIAPSFTPAPVIQKPAPAVVPPPTLKIEPKIITPEMHPIMADKLTNPVQMQTIKTEHSLDNLTKTTSTPTTPGTPAPKVDPYREMPE